MFFLTDLSSSADNDGERRAPHVNPNREHLTIFRTEHATILMPKVYRFSNPYGEPITIELIERSRIPNELALVDDEFIIGVVINGGVYPLWSRRGNQVIVRMHAGKNVVMTPELHAYYDHYFTPFIRHPSVQNLHRRTLPDLNDK